MTDYSQIIRENCEKHSRVAWWPLFAYHCTDVQNAVSILDAGKLFSRADADALGLMCNDNASRQVIQMTKTEAISCVRFYFRPLTPTQYYVEGYKHPQLRYDDDEQANMPVPIFFLFDLGKLLSLPDVKFSEQPQSGYGSELYSGAEAFSKLQFDAIYSSGGGDIEKTKRFRHAEILHQGSLPIDACLHSILCRNSVERLTLLELLQERNSFAFQKYKDKIKVYNDRLFENNGLFVADMGYRAGVVSVRFADSREKQLYTRTMQRRNEQESLRPLRVQLLLDWVNARKALHHSTTELKIDYADPPILTFRDLPAVKGAQTLRMQLLIEGNLMCRMERPLENAVILK